MLDIIHNNEYYSIIDKSKNIILASCDTYSEAVNELFEIQLDTTGIIDDFSILKEISDNCNYNQCDNCRLKERKDCKLILFNSLMKL